jgi:cytochrome c biogenesis protein CcmG/thiol:disulfide interchange protein DsbE
MRRRSFVLVLILALACSAACTKTERSGPKQAGAAPDFTLPDLNGRKVSLADFRGKVVLAEFWATWCPPCRESIPGIERLYQSYGQKGLAVVSVSLDEGDWDSVKEFVKESGITYPVLQGDDDVMKSYRIRSIPALFLINKDGVIVKQYLGAGYDKAIEKDLQALL